VAALTCKRALAGLTWILALHASTLHAQNEWSLAHVFSGSERGRLATDSANARLLLVRSPMREPGVTLWQWDRGPWIQIHRGFAPPPRYDYAIAFDRARGRLVLFGGTLRGGATAGDTWEWDGSNWIELRPPLAPSARSGHSMAWDEAQQRILLFAGYEPASGRFLQDTWAWNGSLWQPLAPAASPPPRTQHAMAEDLVRGRIVLHGGFDGVLIHADTWEWDGALWTQRATAIAPPGDHRHCLAYDPARMRVVLFGASSGETWEWDGAVWSRFTTPLQPRARSSASMAFDPTSRSLLLFGGCDLLCDLADTWSWNGASWNRWADGPIPPYRVLHAMAFDTRRERTLVFGGTGSQGISSDLWEWDGRNWRERRVLVRPPERYASALAYDASRGVCVLFGGSDAGRNALADTWEWDGTAWSQASPTLAPPARSSHRLAYDSDRRRVLLFGGWDASSRALDDLWEWDGVSWTRRPSLVAPPPRASHVMAYDSRRGRLVLYGGVDARPFSDTWEWDGSAWSQALTQGNSGFGEAMAYHEARGRILMWGHGGTISSQTSEWDGRSWSPVEVVLDPPPRYGAAMAYDELRETIVLQGGWDGSLHAYEMWESFVTRELTSRSAARWNSFAPGCSGSLGEPRLEHAVGERPWIGDSFTAVVAPLPAGASAAILLLGLSSSAWGNVALPLDLAAFGMPGCSLAISVENAAPLNASGGTARRSFAVCDGIDLVGASFYLQALIADPSANPTGVVLSNAVACTIGRR
jgi:hypothetical protein